jgi:hypothetical protein
MPGGRTTMIWRLATQILKTSMDIHRLGRIPIRRTPESETLGSLRKYKQHLRQGQLGLATMIHYPQSIRPTRCSRALRTLPCIWGLKGLSIFLGAGNSGLLLCAVELKALSWAYKLSNHVRYIPLLDIQIIELISL